MQGTTFETSNTLPQLATAAAAGSPKISDAGLLLASQAARCSLRVIFVLIVARALGPRQFGIYALLFALTEFLAVASGSGYADYLTREAAQSEPLGWGLASQLVLLRILVAAPLALLEIGALAAMHYPRVVLVGATWMALSVTPRSVSEAVQGVLRGTGRFAGYLSIELIFGGSLVTGGALAAAQRGGLGAAIACELAAAGAAGIAGLFIAWRYRPSKRLGLPRWRLLKTSAVFNLYSFIGTLYDRFDVVLLSKLAGDYATGIYSVAYRALGMTQILSFGVLYSLLPSLSRDLKDPQEQRRLEGAVRLLLVAACFVVLATIILADPAIRILLGPQYAETAAALKILIWAVILRYLNYALNIGLLAAGYERVFVATALTCVAVNLAGNFFLIPHFGWRAAAFLTILTELVLLAQNMYWIRRAVGKIPIPMGLARVSLVFVLAVGAALSGSYLGRPLLAGSAALFCFVAYVCRCGAVAEFASVWRLERSASL